MSHNGFNIAPVVIGFSLDENDMNFPETNWTVLALATLNGGDIEKEALNDLCREYWKPVAACIRAKGAPNERVDDLTQEFFLQLMQKSFFKKADRARGSFRTFILGALRYFLADDVKAQLTQKKGGHLEREQLKENSAVVEAEDASFDSAWAELIFDKVFEQVQREMLQLRGPGAWKMLQLFLPGSDESVTYAELAERMGMTEGGARSEVFRLRKRFREALRVEVGSTVSAPHEIDEELAHLRAALEKR